MKLFTFHSCFESLFLLHLMVSNKLSCRFCVVSLPLSNDAFSSNVIQLSNTGGSMCKDFVTSHFGGVQAGHSSSPADIFNELPIGRNFIGTGMKYAREYTFKTPNYPQLYPNDMDCIKLIKAPTPGHQIILQIVYPISLEPNSLCMMDFLEIRDGPFGFSPMIDRFCSKFLPPETLRINSTGQYLWLRFRSDSTLQHTGFQGVYHFEKIEPRNKKVSIIRRMHSVHLEKDASWHLSQDFFTKKLQFLSAEETHLPLEMVLDIRSPSKTHMMIHIHHFQVPQFASSTCNSEKLNEFDSKHYCSPTRAKSGLTDIKFTDQPYTKNLDEVYSPRFPDKVSKIIGNLTYAEFYSDKTISQTSPPCPSVFRFCISSTENSKDDFRKAYANEVVIASERLVIRMVVAAPKSGIDVNSVLKEFKNDTKRHNSMVGIVDMMPNFKFTITVLNPKINTDCPQNHVACDKTYCLLKSKWCDGIVQCPAAQDEGDDCHSGVKNLIESDASGDESANNIKDIVALEKAAKYKAALQKHGAVIGSISLFLFTITSICLVCAIKRKRKEAQNHVIEIKLPETERKQPIEEKDKSFKSIDEGLENSNLTNSGDLLIDPLSINNIQYFIDDKQKLPILPKKQKFVKQSNQRNTEQTNGLKINKSLISNKFNFADGYPEINVRDFEKEQFTCQSNIEIQQAPFAYKQIEKLEKGKLVREDSTLTTETTLGYRSGQLSNFEISKPVAAYSCKHTSSHHCNETATTSNAFQRELATPHLPNCRIAGKVHSTGGSFKIQNSLDFIEYDSASSESCKRQQNNSQRYKKEMKNQPGGNYSKKPSEKNVQEYSNNDFSKLSKLFRSMPDVNGQLFGKVKCGHKDCRDLYRLHIIRSGLQIEQPKQYPKDFKYEHFPVPSKHRKIIKKDTQSLSTSSCCEHPPTPDYSLKIIPREKMKEQDFEVWLTDNERDFKTTRRPTISRDKEIELSSDEFHLTDKADAFSVHGLSDAISNSSRNSSIYKSDNDEFDRETCSSTTSSMQHPMCLIKSSLSKSNPQRKNVNARQIAQPSAPTKSQKKSAFHWLGTSGDTMHGSNQSTISPIGAFEKDKLKPECLMYEYEA